MIVCPRGDPPGVSYTLRFVLYLYFFRIFSVLFHLFSVPFHFICILLYIFRTLASDRIDLLSFS